MQRGKAKALLILHLDQEREREGQRCKVEGEEENAEIATLALPAHLKITAFSPKSPPDALHRIH